MFDSLFKKIIRDFQDENNNNKSVEAVNKYIKNFSMMFCYNYNKSFYTSDNPIVDEVGEDVPTKYKGQIFPLTPHLIVIGYKGNKEDNHYPSLFKPVSYKKFCYHYCLKTYRTY